MGAGRSAPFVPRPIPLRTNDARTPELPHPLPRMTSLWDLLKDWVLVAVLVTVSLAVMFAQNQTLVRGMRAGALEASARIEGTFAWVGNYLRALDTNQRLRAENIALAAEVARSREARAENTRLQSMLDLRDTTRFRVEPARIISKELSGQQNRFTINAGGRDSVEAGMPVIDERGAVLGRVALVSPSYSRVTPYLNADFRVAGKVQSLGAEGSRDQRVERVLPARPGHRLRGFGHDRAGAQRV
ncbi:MAG: rod shape-determining protein MreC [Bacteroidetes bacterium QS_9_68_14]|nr:MAG: rod shape-determining protein MreC [Bacteroidetes bacterium QS_9_68_14]